MNNEKIGIYISSKRKEKNLTQRELAKKLYVSDKAVSKWERGICMPDISLIEKLSTILDVSISEILKGEDIEKDKDDELLKESISFFQKDYFNKRILKTSIIAIFSIFIFYIALLTIGEFNNGELTFSIWGNESTIELPTYSKIKAKKSTKKYLKAVQKFDEDKIMKMLRQNPNREFDYNTAWITFDDYLISLNNIKEKGVYFSKFKLNYCFKSDLFSLNYTCIYDLLFDYNNKHYQLLTSITDYNGIISLSTLDLGNTNKSGDYEPFWKLKDKELYSDIEKIFYRY